VFSGAFGGEGAGNGQFHEPAGIAVAEGTGNVYVVDRGNERVQRFSATGSFLSMFSGSETPSKAFSSPTGIAVDNPANPEGDPSAGDVYVVDAKHHVIDKFSGGGAYLSQLTEAGGVILGKVSGLAVDRSGNLWVYEESGKVNEFSDTGSFVTSFTKSLGSPPPGLSDALAVDAAGNTYLVSAFEVLQKYNAAFEEVGAAESEKASGRALATNSRTNALFVDEGSRIAELGRFGEPFTRPLETFGAEQLSGSFDVTVDAATETVYATTTEADRVAVFIPEPAAAPTVSNVFSRNVTATSAELEAEINPKGAPTTYYVQYGRADCGENPSSCTDQPMPPGNDAGEGFGGQHVSVVVQGLSPITSYHYRVIATNNLGHAESGDQTFITQPAGGEFALPDGRAWEMVSPLDKHGANIEPIGVLGQIQASGNGGAITYLTTAPLGNPAGNDMQESQILSSRGSDGWSSQNISTPHNEVTGSGHPSTEYRLFAPDLSLGLVEPLGELPLSPEVSEKTIYLRDSSGSFLPLVTAANANAGFGGKLRLIDATPDLSRAIVSSSVALTPAAKGGLYEWTKGGTGVEGQLQLVSVLPDGEPAGPEVALGSSEFGPFNPYTNVRDAISENGRRLYWTHNIPEGEGPHLYLRDTSTAETVQVDAAQGAPEPTNGDAVFQDASADGSKVFFTDGQKLTPDSRAGGREARDLYEFELTSGEGKLAGKLTDLTAKVEPPSESAEVQGDVMGTSRDGSFVYFVADGVLAAGATPGNCHSESGESCNLYVSHDGTTTLIATLSNEDRNDWAAGREQDLGFMTSRVSPDGRYLAFMSNRSLTGYDNRDVNTGGPDEEVFLYDTNADRLVCASCSPSGARPVGVFHAFGERRLLVDRTEEWSGRGLAGSVPGWMENGPSVLYQSRYLDDTGRMFFDSADALVPQDANGKEDVYEYEPNGIGSCTTSSDTFSARSDGCIALISSGTSGEESAFLDASEGGGDAFFLTTARLASQDSDTSFDVYDAHECSAQSPCPGPIAAPSAPCTSSNSCRGEPAPQPSLTGPPPSQFFSGTGNLAAASPPPRPKPKALTRAQLFKRALKVCRKKPKRDRRSCEARAKERYGPKHRSGKASRGSK